ncbi:MAG TPA: PspC domain-containing protein, partial [Streptosporangiaceae bacterium]|nr:PspC domain-containing protein [Streptosporangiaceae bacterium]
MSTREYPDGARPGRGAKIELMVDQANAAAGTAAAQSGGQFGVPSEGWQPPPAGAPPRADGSPDSAAAPPGAGQAHWTTRLESHGIRLTRGPASPGPLRRARDGQVLGGVAAGVAKRTGLSVGLIRVVIVVAALITTGYLAMPYVLAWFFIPAEGADSNIASKALRDKRGIGLAVGLTSVLVVALVIASALNASFLPAVPLIVCAAGLVLITRNAPEEELAYLRSLGEPAGLTSTAPRSRRVLRLAIGAVLIIFGLYALLQGHERLALLRPLAGVVLLVGGIVL